MSYVDTECDSCGKPWDIWLTMACVHEHIGQVRFCVNHRYRLDGELSCVPCIGDHDCRLFVDAVLEDHALAGSGVGRG